MKNHCTKNLYVCVLYLWIHTTCRAHKTYTRECMYVLQTSTPSSQSLSLVNCSSVTLNCPLVTACLLLLYYFIQCIRFENVFQNLYIYLNITVQDDAYCHCVERQSFSYKTHLLQHLFLQCVLIDVYCPLINQSRGN